MMMTMMMIRQKLNARQAYDLCLKRAAKVAAAADLRRAPFCFGSIAVSSIRRHVTLPVYQICTDAAKSIAADHFVGAGSRDGQNTRNFIIAALWPRPQVHQRAINNVIRASGGASFVRVQSISERCN